MDISCVGAYLPPQHHGCHDMAVPANFREVRPIKLAYEVWGGAFPDLGPGGEHVSRARYIQDWNHIELLAQNGPFARRGKSMRK